MPNNKNKKPLVTYPCQWLYKVIGTDEPRMRKAIAIIIGSNHYTVTKSNNSKNGKYCCLNLETIVNNENTRNAIYKKLGETETVKVVL